MSRNLLFVTSIVVIVLAAMVVYGANSHTRENPEITAQNYKPGRWVEADSAINQSKQIYKTRKELGDDLSSGPCLTNALMDGWVLDLVHVPRTSVDDKPANQCQGYIEGKATHFVELSIDGNFVRAK